MSIDGGDGESKLLCLPRSSCSDIEGECPVCGHWLGSPLVVEDAEWSEGPRSSKYRFVAWQHWDFSRRDLISRIDFLVTGWDRAHPLVGVIDQLASPLGTNRAHRQCPGSFRTITVTRPVHGGGSHLRWGPRWRDELVRVLTVLTSEPLDRDRVARARGLISEIEKRWDDVVPIRVSEEQRGAVASLPFHEERQKVMRNVEQLLEVVKEILR